MLDFSRPGKPTDNAFIEAFNGRFRAECLNAHWFLTLTDAGESWRISADTTMRSARTGQSGINAPISLVYSDGEHSRHPENRLETLPSRDPGFGSKFKLDKTLSYRYAQYERLQHSKLVA